MNRDNYEPFGPEWEKEVMKNDKKTIVALYRSVCIANKKLRDESPSVGEGEAVAFASWVSEEGWSKHTGQDWWSKSFSSEYCEPVNSADLYQLFPGKVKAAPPAAGEGFKDVVALDYERENYLLPEHIFGIPLSPSVLEDCGFENGKAWLSKYLILYFNLGKRKEAFMWDTGLMEWFIETSSFDLSHIKYLHQLQNLYHSLTGTELIYKPKK